MNSGPALGGTAAPSVKGSTSARPSAGSSASAPRPGAAASASTPSTARSTVPGPARTAAGRTSPTGPPRRRTPVAAAPGALEGEVLPPLPADPAATRPPVVRSRPARAAAASPHPDPAVAEHTLPAAARAKAPGWDRRALRRLGVPTAVVNALPAEDPTDDLGWLTALTAAITACVPAPGVVGPDCPVVVDGYGLEGAVGMLQAGVKGVAPGTLVLEGRAAPATAVELALVLRAHVTGG